MCATLCWSNPPYKKKGLETESSPAVGTAVIKSDVGYHIREDGHSVETFDWLRFLEFAEYQLKK